MVETLSVWRHRGQAMKSVDAGALLLSLCAIGAACAQDLAGEEFTDEDFAQFFGLIEDGKITREKMNARCEKEVVGFTFAGAELLHEGGPQRIEYNLTGMNGSVDGRALRSRHYNATFGEWTGAVFKPLCPGMWVVTVDFQVGGTEAGAVESPATTGVRLHVYVRTAGEERPGRSVLRSADVRSGYGGHLTIALPLRSGDEVSTWSEAVVASADAPSRRTLERVTFTAYKIGHLAKYVEEFDVDAWNAELEALK